MTSCPALVNFAMPGARQGWGSLVARAEGDAVFLFGKQLRQTHERLHSACRVTRVWISSDRTLITDSSQMLQGAAGRPWNLSEEYSPSCSGTVSACALTAAASLR